MSAAAVTSVPFSAALPLASPGLLNPIIAAAA